MNLRLNTIILEDQKIESDRLKACLCDFCEKQKIELNVTLYTSGEDFFHKDPDYMQHAPNVFFLDIQMNGMSGMDVAKQIRRDGYHGPIIFLTAFKEFVFDGYDVRAMNYLLKPLNTDILHRCLTIIVDNLINATYLYRNKQDFIRIPYENILTFSSNRHSIDILTTEGHYEQYATLNSILEHLPKQFVQTSRSCIVNMAHIDMISRNTITLTNRMTQTIARNYIKSVIEAFAHYSMQYDYSSKGDYYD